MINLARTKDGRSYLGPFLLISSLFFMWGFAHAILEVLNPHFKNLLNLNHANASWVQVATYGAYFLMAIPAGKIISRYGYKRGVLTGLVLYGVGALLFLPICLLGVNVSNPQTLYPLFIGALFVIGCGLTCLETSANPYATVLGDPKNAERRINFAQSFNGLGWICGPLVGGLIFFGGTGGEAKPSLISVAAPYCGVGIFVLLAALIFKHIHLPEPKDSAEEAQEADGQAQNANGQTTSADSETLTANSQTLTATRSMWSNKIYVFGVVALFLYVAAQTGVNSNFVAYMYENVGISRAEASLWLSFGGMGLFLVGRLLGSWIMGYIRPEKLMLLFAIGATVGSAVVVGGLGKVSLAAFFLIYLCESIMFPTIFSLALRGAKGHTKQASSYLIMTIVGGAIAPLLMGTIADAHGIAVAFIIPLVCYVFIGWYAGMLTKKRA